MTVPRILSGLALTSSIILSSGCGGSTPEIDTAETQKNEPAKPSSTPTPTPDSTPPKDGPKG